LGADLPVDRDLLADRRRGVFGDELAPSARPEGA
jgi:hypothetical protein